MNELVAIVKMKEFEYQFALQKALDLIEFDCNTLFGKSVLIKPNLCDVAPPESGITTDVALIKAIVQVARKNGSKKIAIAESNHWLATADEEFRRLGFQELHEDKKVSLINLSTRSSYRIQLDGKHFETIKVPKDLMDYDYFITVPKLKTHPNYYITCSLKNQFGMNPERYKSKHHAFMNETLFDLNRLYWPDLVLVDANFVEIGDNASEKVGLLIVGTNPVAVDCVVARLFGIDSKRIPHLRYFLRRIPPFQTKIVGERLDECTLQTSFETPRKPSMLLKFGYLIIRLGDKIGLGDKKLADFGYFVVKAANYLAGVQLSQLLNTMLKAYHDWKASLLRKKRSIANDIQ